MERTARRGHFDLPQIMKAGFILGAQGGKGALAVGRRWRRCYTIGAASFGPQAGVEWFR